MKKLIIAALCTLFTAHMAYAADASCEAKAAEKKLKGAAQSSFMKKCEADAKTAAPAAKAAAVPAAAAGSDCEAKAVSKKGGKPLHGAAKASFMKKCEKDAKAAAPAAK